MTGWPLPGHPSIAPLAGLRSAVEWGLTLPGALGAAWASFGFGMQLGGAVMGAVAAVNGAVCAAMVIGALFDRAWPKRRPTDA